MKIFAIIITYNGLQWYEKCFNSLRQSHVPVQAIVVDNASNDGTIPYIRTNYPEFYLIPQKKNIGFAKANNIAIKYALKQEADYIFLLNQDTWIQPTTIELLIDFIKKEENVGIISPIHANGSNSGFDLKFASYLPQQFYSDIKEDQLRSIYYVSFINAAAWLMDCKCVKKVGGFDTSLFVHYGEDDNYCQRVIYHGFKIAINTQSFINHDREKRLESEDSDHHKKIWKNQNVFIGEKIKFGNINIDFDLNLKKKNLLRELKGSLYCLDYKYSIKIIKKLKLISIIRHSRRINKNDGNFWLKKLKKFNQ